MSGGRPLFQSANRLPAEDSVSVGRNTEVRADAAVKVAVPAFSRIANFDDLDPLVAEPDVEVQFVEPGRALPGDADLVILPGSKATIGDMRFLRSQGWDVDIRAHLRRGGWLLGLCGGYQKARPHDGDPHGIEGAPGEEPGLGVLALDTELTGAKQLVETSGTERMSGQPVQGYEMHMGATTGPARSVPMLDLGGRSDARSPPTATSWAAICTACSQAMHSGPPFCDAWAGEPRRGSPGSGRSIRRSTHSRSTWSRAWISTPFFR